MSTYSSNVSKCTQMCFNCCGSMKKNSLLIEADSLLKKAEGWVSDV